LQICSNGSEKVCHKLLEAPPHLRERERERERVPLRIPQPVLISSKHSLCLWLFSLNLWLKKIATLKEREKRTICTDSVMCFMKEATIRLDPERERKRAR
jgi:hypothetical protein